MVVTIKILRKKTYLNTPQIIKIVKKIFHYQRINRATLTFTFVSHQMIRSLNRKFLHRDYATDVLAFDLRGAHKDQGVQVNGDIVVSIDAAIKGTKIYHTSLDREIILYVIHGVLHLLGFDDHTPLSIKRMRKKEEELLGVVEKDIKLVLRR